MKSITPNSNFFDKNSRVNLRAKLVRAARHAFMLWNSAVALLNERMTAIRPSAACIQEAASIVAHRKARYMTLEAALVTDTGLDPSSVFNDVVNAFPCVPRLMNANL